MFIQFLLMTCVVFQQGFDQERIYHDPLRNQSFYYEIPQDYIQKPNVIQGPILEELSKRFDERISPLFDKTILIESRLLDLGDNLKNILEELREARDERSKFLDAIIESRIERQEVLDSIKELRSDRTTILETLSQIVKDRQTILDSIKELRNERQTILESLSELRKDREELKEGLSTVGKLGGNIREILDEARANRAEFRVSLRENIELARANLKEWTPLKDFIERINAAIKSLIMTLVWVAALLVAGLVLLGIFGAIIAKMYAKIKKIVPIPGI